MKLSPGIHQICTLAGNQLFWCDVCDDTEVRYVAVSDNTTVNFNIYSTEKREHKLWIKYCTLIFFFFYSVVHLSRNAIFFLLLHDYCFIYTSCWNQWTSKGSPLVSALNTYGQGVAPRAAAALQGNSLILAGFPISVQHCWAKVPVFREHSLLLFCMKLFLATALTVGVWKSRRDCVVFTLQCQMPGLMLPYRKCESPVVSEST